MRRGREEAQAPMLMDRRLFAIPPGKGRGVGKLDLAQEAVRVLRGPLTSPAQETPVCGPRYPKAAGDCRKSGA